MNNLPTVSTNFGQWRKNKKNYESPLIGRDKVKRRFKQAAIKQSIKRRQRDENVANSRKTYQHTVTSEHNRQ